MPSARVIVVIAAGAIAPLVLRVLMRHPNGRLASRLGGVVVPFLTVVALGASIGGLAGIAESAHLALRHLIEGNLARSFGWDVLWMAPASAALIFTLIAVVLGFAFPVRGGVALTPCLFVLTLLAAYSVLQEPHYGLYGWSALTLSLGLAVLAVRFVTGRSERVVPAVRWMSRLALPGFALLALGGLWYMPKPREARALARLPEASGGRPNVLLLVLDTVRAASLGLYDHSRTTTPNLEKLAQRGVVYDWAISTAPWTLPSHASMFTGLYPTALEVDYNVPLAEHHQTLAEVLRDRGYVTAGFVANMAFTTRISGLAQGFARYEDWPMTWGRFIESAWLSRAIGRRLLPLSRLPWRGAKRKVADENIADFLGWLDTRRAPERPFFAFLNFIDAHDPYTAPNRLRERFLPAGPAVLRKRQNVTEAELASTHAAYQASIALIDEELGRLMGELAHRGLLDNTLIIVVSDHGEQFGEHGLQFHGNSLYLPLIHVPLMLVYPKGIPGGVRVHRPVSLRDIPATVLHIVTGSVDHTFPGRSLLDPARQADTVSIEPLLSAEQKPYMSKPWEPAFKGSMRSLLRFPYHLIRHEDGRQELYQVERDPAERQNLAATADPLLIQGLVKAMDSLSAP